MGTPRWPRTTTSRGSASCLGEAGAGAGGADEEQRGHLLQERSAHHQDHLLLQHLQQVQEPTPAEGQAHGGARPQEDGQHLLQHLHGCPLTHVPNLPVTFSPPTSSVKNSLLYKQVSAFNSRSLSPNT